VVKNQIANLTPGLCFGHNLCIRCPNGSCKLVTDIYVPRSFQWCKEHLNPMSFDPCNRPLKIWESIGTITPKMGVHLGSVRLHSLTFFCTFRSVKCDSRAHSWPTPSQTLALVASPRLGLQHLPFAISPPKVESPAKKSMINQQVSLVSQMLKN